MKYLVLARRYRPQTFSDVMGQETIITTLKNALRFDRVAHAYLFCGSRGVGKTTIARLFAKALNCQALGTDLEPCNRCSSCLEILSGQSLDVIEIDGASNRGIDDIRQLNETIGYAPSHGKYKIYIIDEVHMLTKEAFNALLKTLEEPPPRAKFFFATTEPHKILPTIVSRCQRFDMQRLTEAQIAQKLLTIAKDLKREISPEAIHLIASFSEGSLRDAESLFDQILCFTDDAIQAEQVRNVLGLVSDELFFEFDSAFNEGRVSFAFELVESLFKMGKDLSHFLEQLIGHYRRLTLAKTMGTPSLCLPEPLFSRVNRAVKLYTQAQLFYILETLLNAFAPLQKSPMQRASLESILLQILRSKNRIPIEVLIRRLNELEQNLSKNELSANIPIDSNSSSEPDRILRDSDVLDTDANVLCVNEAEKQAKPSKSDPTPKNEIPKPLPKLEVLPEPDVLPRKIEPCLEASVPVSDPNLTKPSVKAETIPSAPIILETVSLKAPTLERKPDPGRYETLLRFAAVELEGTIKN